MKHLVLASLAVLALGASAPAQAANARNPYGNVDRRTDAGNDTGNAEVDRLNDMQLDRNYQGPRYPVGPGIPPGPPPGYAPAPSGPPVYAPPPGYAPPSPAPRRY